MIDTRVTGQATLAGASGDGLAAATGDQRDARGHGWLTFAVVMFLVAAAFNTVYGIAAFANDDYFAADELLFGDLSMWGAFYLTIAALQVGAALAVWSRAGFGLGIALAMLNATVALLSIGAYPLWSITVMVVDAMIIYGLAVYGFGGE
jgi:hypothetical protein